MYYCYYNCCDGPWYKTFKWLGFGRGPGCKCPSCHRVCYPVDISKYPIGG